MTNQTQNHIQLSGNKPFLLFIVIKQNQYINYEHSHLTSISSDLNLN